MRHLRTYLIRVFNKLLASVHHSVISGNGSDTHFVILVVKCLKTHLIMMFLISYLICAFSRVISENGVIFILSIVKYWRTHLIKLFFF